MSIIISGVRVYIDGDDITEYLFGQSYINIDNDNGDIFRDLDLSPFLGTPGNHLLQIYCDNDSGIVEARLEIT